jgi:hypothetical protein
MVQVVARSKQSSVAASRRRAHNRCGCSHDGCLAGWTEHKHLAQEPRYALCSRLLRDEGGPRVNPAKRGAPVVR